MREENTGPKKNVLKRVNTRITFEQDFFIKKESNRTGKGEGEIHRELLTEAINSRRGK